MNPSNDPNEVAEIKSYLSKSFLKYWGYNHFRSNQLDVCVDVLLGHDTVMIASTGSGKSICYQLPSLALRDMGVQATTIVISPLISLMEDQIASLHALGISAGFIGSNCTIGQERDAMAGKYAVLYATPEKIVRWQHGLVELSQSTNVICLAIDESHCVSEWGHDFRPDYRNLSEIRDTLNTHNKLGMNIPILALTATATPAVEQDIISNLNMKKTRVFKTTFNRPNLKYIVRLRSSSSSSGYQDLSDTLLIYKDLNLDGTFTTTTSTDVTDTTAVESTATVPPSQRKSFPSTLIYVSTIKESEELTDQLQRDLHFRNRNLRIACYHASLNSSTRSQVHQAFLHDEIHIVIATIAFGMGIHKPDIRLLINYGLPKSIESYYQQSGRAGRDGLPAFCVLLYHRNDVVKSFNISMNRSSGNNSHSHSASISQNDIVQKRIYEMNSYATLNLSNINSNNSSSADNTQCQCRRQYLLNFFEEYYNCNDKGEVSSSCCDLCDERKRFNQQQQQSSSSSTSFDNKGTLTDNQITGVHRNPLSSTIDQIKNFGREVYLLLLTVADCRECYGITMSINVLLGSHSKALEKLGQYQYIRTFGLGVGCYSAVWWKALATLLTEPQQQQQQRSPTLASPSSPSLSSSSSLLATVLVKTASFFSYEKFVLTSSGRMFLKQYSHVAKLLDERVFLLKQQHHSSGNSSGSNSTTALPSHSQQIATISASITKALQSIGYSFQPTGHFRNVCSQEGSSRSSSAGISSSSSTSFTGTSTLKYQPTISTLSNKTSTTTISSHLMTEAEKEAYYLPLLFDQLTQLRLSLSQSLHMTSYNILSTTDLKELLVYRPVSVSELEGRSGWGQWKIHKFGQDFCTLIQQFCIQHQLSTSVTATTIAVTSSPTSTVAEPVVESTTLATVDEKENKNIWNVTAPPSSSTSLLSKPSYLSTATGSNSDSSSSSSSIPANNYNNNNNNNNNNSNASTNNNQTLSHLSIITNSNTIDNNNVISSNIGLAITSPCTSTSSTSSSNLISSQQAASYKHQPTTTLSDVQEQQQQPQSHHHSQLLPPLKKLKSMTSLLFPKSSAGNRIIHGGTTLGAVTTTGAAVTTPTTTNEVPKL